MKGLLKESPKGRLFLIFPHSFQLQLSSVDISLENTNLLARGEGMEPTGDKVTNE